MRLTDGVAATTLMDELLELVADTVTWETELSGPVTRETNLVAELGFQSLDIVMLILAIEGRFERQGLPFDEILVEGDGYVSDLSVGVLAGFLERHLGAGGPA